MIEEGAFVTGKRQRLYIFAEIFGKSGGKCMTERQKNGKAGILTGAVLKNIAYVTMFEIGRASCRERVSIRV